MLRTLKFALAGVLVVGVLATLLVTGSALAQEATPTSVPQAPGVGLGRGWPGGFGFGMCGQAGFEAIAKALNLSADQLTAELWGGRTLAELADRAGVSLTTVRDAAQAACRDVQKQVIEQAVQDGRLSREKADWLIEGLEKGFWGFGAGVWQDGCGYFCRGAGMGLGRGLGAFGRWRGDWDDGPQAPKGPQGRFGGFMRGKGGVHGWFSGPMGGWQQRSPQQPTE
ncbi:MAG: hypothetical protein ACUVSF_04960 [Anaerolineae bacterium]